MAKQRLITVLILIVIVPLGFITKFYSGPAEDWINNSVGGLLYEVFWCLVIAFIFTKIKPIKIAIWVFIITCMLEFLQLWHPVFLEVVRNNFIGRIILGNSFNWMDFPYYFAGSILGYLILAGIIRLPAKLPSIRNTSSQ
ncbi:MAG: DUF2809 domain-containing protein [Bacteroidales bacterium]|nr:DUF2809 domain-containing protein [Bacteroidales bacterium]